MNFSFRWFCYSLCKPFHSAKHKACKKAASAAALERRTYETALAEVAEYTRESAGEIERQNALLAKQLNERDFDRCAASELEDFYVNDRHYLYELPLWNAGSGRPYYFVKAVFPYLRTNGYLNVLDFGAGSGDLCMALQEHGFHAHYTDINRNLIAFSSWRFARRGLDIPIFAPQDLSSRKFDCVLSFDVFEHLKDLPARIKGISGLIRQGGSLVFNIEFSGEGLHLQENKRFADAGSLDAVLRAAGLRFQWRFKQIFFYKKT